MKKTYFQSRPGSLSLLARAVACFLLAVLALHVQPFSFTVSSYIEGGGDGAVARHIRPLQVCGDTDTARDFLIDHLWVPIPSILYHHVPEREKHSMAVPLSPAEVYLPSVFRPPRLSQRHS
jgi:hypothetical protein